MRVRLGSLGMQLLQLFMITGVDKLAEGIAQQLKRRQPDEVGHVVAHVNDVALLAQHEAEAVEGVDDIDAEVGLAQLCLHLGRNTEAGVGHNVSTLEVRHCQPKKNKNLSSPIQMGPEK